MLLAFGLACPCKGAGFRAAADFDHMDHVRRRVFRAESERRFTPRLRAEARGRPSMSDAYVWAHLGTCGSRDLRKESCRQAVVSTVIHSTTTLQARLAGDGATQQQYAALKVPASALGGRRRVRKQSYRQPAKAQQSSGVDAPISGSQLIRGRPTMLGVVLVWSVPLGCWHP